MSKSELSNTKVTCKSLTKKSRFGGPVRLYRDPLHAFRARGAVLSRARDGAKNTRLWSVVCPVHYDVMSSAILALREDKKWEFSCDYCDNLSDKKKLRRICKLINITVDDFYIREV